MAVSASATLRCIEEFFRELYHRIKDLGIPPVLKVALLIAFLFALKESLKGIFGFECPRVGYEFYGNLYIYGPSVIILCFALVFSRSFWEFVTGFCRLNCSKRLLASASSAINIYLAFSAPVLWIAFALLETDYYVCANYGPKILEERWRDRDNWALHGRQHSSQCQIIAWEIILAWAVITTVVVSIWRFCCKKQQDSSVII